VILTVSNFGYVQDGMPQAVFRGGSMVVQSSGGTFEAAHQPGHTVGWDFTVTALKAMTVPTTPFSYNTVDEVFGDTSGGDGVGVQSAISTGQIPAVPEPATVLLIGAGVAVLGRFLRRKPA
jgi:hypothetical protein